MKIKIKVKYIGPAYKLTQIKKGDWVDLRSRITNVCQKGDLYDFPLGVAMKLPKGTEAYILPRSSTPKNFGFIMPNSMGVIDNSYCGDKDEWKCSALFFTRGSIYRGDRICQFRIQLSQKATVWDKIKWLFSSGIKFIEVDSLEGESRGGFGTTGKA